VDDLGFLAGTLVFFALSLSYAAYCDRLLSKSGAP
jgi:hypothetical protein